MEMEARNRAKSQGRGGTANGRQGIDREVAERSRERGLRIGAIVLRSVPHPTNYRIKPGRNRGPRKCSVLSDGVGSRLSGD